MTPRIAHTGRVTPARVVSALRDTPKIVHWTAFNGSGMNQVAQTMAEAEQRCGMDSTICNIDQGNFSWDHLYDADIHVAHTHFPDAVARGAKRCGKAFKLVYVAHGTPEHVLENSITAGLKGGYGHGDGFMLFQHWLKVADARVTFWERHAAIYRTMVPRSVPIHCIPLGVDKAFWSAGTSQGKYAGSPSLFTAENPHAIKWPLDLFTLWPWVYPEMEGACLHACYVVMDQHRWIAPLINANGASYAMHWSAITHKHESLRNVFKSIDYYIGLVTKGDFNRISLEANAAGAQTISYAGNPYSSFWLPEGDQRLIAAELLRILKGEVEPRKDRREVPDMMETTNAMVDIYKSLLMRSDAPKQTPVKRRRHGR